MPDPSPDTIFGSTQIRQSAKRLLDNYSNPWDPVAETVQNAVDAINTEYQMRLADELDIPYSTDEEGEADLETAIESAADAIVDIDSRSFNEVSFGFDFDKFERAGLPDGAKWGNEDYFEWVKTEYYQSLANALGKDADQIRSADEGVRDSYHGKITVKRELGNRGIEVIDNGIGMSPDQLEEALQRYGSLKSRGGLKTSQIGELGNGLTYVLTNCNEFVIETCDGETISRASIEGMQDWVNGGIDGEDVTGSSEILEEDTDEPSYTKVISRDIRDADSEYPDLFDDLITKDRMIHLLRNKTAIGQLFDVVYYPAYHTLRQNEVDVEYIEISPEGDEEPESVEFLFQGPAQVAKRAGEDPSASFPVQIDIRRAHELEEDRTTDIGEKSVVAKGVWKSPGGIEHYYEAFIASRSRYRELCREYGYCNDPNGSVQDNVFDLEPGIEIGVKSMPCGIRIDTPVSGSAGYWGNLYIMIMNNSLTFDEGREKPATGRRGKNFKDCAQHVLFQEFGTDVISSTTQGSGVGAVYEGSLVDERTDGKKPLDFDCLEPLNFRNEPTSEQDVVAIFHEALGKEIFPDSYEGIDTSTWHAYDEIYDYHVDLDTEADRIGSRIIRGLREQGYDELSEKVVVEFKEEGSDIFDDLSSNKKIYAEIDLLICWTFDEGNDMGVTLSDKPSDEIRYWGTTHQFEIDSHLLFDASNHVDVIVLTELFERVDNDDYTVY